MSDRTSFPLFGVVYGAGMCLLLGLLIFGTAGRDTSAAAKEYEAMKEEIVRDTGSEALLEDADEKETVSEYESGDAGGKQRIAAGAAAGIAASLQLEETADSLEGSTKGTGTSVTEEEDEKKKEAAAKKETASKEETEAGSREADQTGTETEEEKKDAAASSGSIYARYKAMNSDFAGILSFPCLDMEYPIVQGENNSEYLTKTFSGKESAAGCVFLDYTASSDLSDRNTFIFAHNMADGTMFGSLKTLSAVPNLQEKYPDGIFFSFKGEGIERTFRVISFGPVDKNDDAIYCHVAADDAYDAWLNHAVSGGWYTPGETVLTRVQKERPNLCILSTCWGTEHQKNFIVIGALEEGAADT